MRLLVAFYNRLDVKLVLMNGSRCTHYWEPPDWKTRGQDARVTVILNMWNDHVFTYNTDVGAPPEVSKDTWAEEDRKSVV